MSPPAACASEAERKQCQILWHRSLVTWPFEHALQRRSGTLGSSGESARRRAPGGRGQSSVAEFAPMLTSGGPCCFAIWRVTPTVRRPLECAEQHPAMSRPRVGSGDHPQPASAARAEAEIDRVPPHREQSADCHAISRTVGRAAPSRHRCRRWRLVACVFQRMSVRDSGPCRYV